MVIEDIRKNWGNYLKIGALLIAISAWGYNAQAQWTIHASEMRDSVKLLMLICKNTAHTPIDKIDCYTTLEKR
jgi:hypothetical protein